MIKLLFFLSVQIFSISLFSFSFSDSVKTYYENGNVKAIFFLKDQVKDGQALFFFENGNIRMEAVYSSGKVDGPVKKFDENGVLKEFFVIENGRKSGPSDYFDSAGAYFETVYFSEGLRTDLPTFADIFEIKKETVLIPEVTVPDISAQNNEQPGKTKPRKDVPETVQKPELEDDPAFYTTFDSSPTFEYGESDFYARLFYPTYAKENKIEGTVQIRAYISNKGEVVQAEILNDVGYGFGTSALITVSYTRFLPAKVNDKSVNSIVIIPVEFKLNR